MRYRDSLSHTIHIRAHISHDLDPRTCSCCMIKRDAHSDSNPGVPLPLLSQGALDLSPLNQSGKAFKGPVKGGLDIIGKTACWQLPHSEMVCDTLAAHALPRTGLIGAVTVLKILFLFTFHGSTSTQRDSYCTYGLNLVISLGLKTNGYLLPGIH